MPQIVLEDVTISFSDKPVLNEVNASIYKGDKIALIGRNGEGKSTLLKILTGALAPTEGVLKIKTGVRLSYLAQVVPAQSNDTVFSIVASGLEQGTILARYQNALDGEDMASAEGYQQQIEEQGLWDSLTEVHKTISTFGLSASDTLATLSGGWRRRVMLARALISNPDILLLDEPTNHLDIDAILSLEKLLQNTPKTLIFISHDRSFVANIASKIFDLDRGNLRVFNCAYRPYLERKEEILNAEELANKRFDKKLAEEEVWIRQGIKARRKRNEGRVRALMQMRGEFKERRSVQGVAKIHTLEEEKKFSKVVFEVKDVSYSIADKNLIEHFSTLVLKGDKIGIMGGNGVGKSTFIKLLLGELAPDSGNIRRAKDLKIAYFDQLFDNLNGEMLVKDFIADGAEHINIGGKNKHVIGYLRQFLFTGKQALAPIKMLSGGEKNRLMLAKTLAKPANILVLDEPTNDLDVETLELLEEMLSDYEGTLIVITHDREFLNNVVQSTIVMDGKNIVRCIGGYDDYLRSAQQQTSTTTTPTTASHSQGKIDKEKQKKERSLLQIIEKQEKIIGALRVESGKEEFYTQDDYVEKLQNLKELENNLAQLYTQWEELYGA